MNHRVAVDAGCFVARLCPREVMDRTRCHRAMALAAENIDGRHVQEPCVLRTVRRVAGKATLTLHRSMLEDKRSALFHVAFGTDCVLVRGRSQVVVPEGPVHIMAIGAVDRALIHLVVEGH